MWFALCLRKKPAGAACGKNTDERRRFFRSRFLVRWLGGPAPGSDGDPHGALQIAQRLLATTPPGATPPRVRGRWWAQVPGDPELLTLKALAPNCQTRHHVSMDRLGIDSSLSPRLPRPGPFPGVAPLHVPPPAGSAIFGPRAALCCQGFLEGAIHRRRGQFTQSEIQRLAGEAAALGQRVVAP